MKTRIMLQCPQCRRTIVRRMFVPFAVLLITCRSCGVSLLVRNPDYSERDLERLPRCLDCGMPIPRIPKAGQAIYRPHQPLCHGLSRTCPSCWLSHRKEEPGGEDLDEFMRHWWRTGLSVAQSVRGTIINSPRLATRH